MSHLFFFISLIILTLSLSGQEQECSSFRFMFYNCENFFDNVDDSTTTDNEFLPTGERGWSYARYQRKINSVAKVIIAAGSIDPPEIVALCEIESEKVAKDLVMSPLLNRFNYRFVAGGTRDPRGIRLILLYRYEKIKLLGSKSHLPSDLIDNMVHTRDILEVGLQAGCDTFNVFLNHWPSRRGGVLAGESSRKIISSYLKNLCDSLRHKTIGDAFIIVAGDFNKSVDSDEISALLKPNGCYLQLLAAKGENGINGTYKYRGRWEDIDMIFVSSGLKNLSFKCNSELIRRVFDNDFLLVKDPGYPGLMPFSTYAGYSYKGGYSDHLPVMADIPFRTVRK